MLDRNGSGGINLDDLTGVMRAMGAQLDDEDILAMFEAVDENGQKSITYEGNSISYCIKAKLKSGFLMSDEDIG